VTRRGSRTPGPRIRRRPMRLMPCWGVEGARRRPGPRRRRRPRTRAARSARCSARRKRSGSRRASRRPRPAGSSGSAVPFPTATTRVSRSSWAATESGSARSSAGRLPMVVTANIQARSCHVFIPRSQRQRWRERQPGRPDWGSGEGSVGATESGCPEALRGPRSHPRRTLGGDTRPGVLRDDAVLRGTLRLSGGFLGRFPWPLPHWSSRRTTANLSS
jgi:hypothetical protein